MVYLFSAFLLTGVSCNALYHLFRVLLEIKLTFQQADVALMYYAGTYLQLQEAVLGILSNLYYVTGISSPKDKG